MSLVVVCFLMICLCFGVVELMMVLFVVVYDLMRERLIFLLLFVIVW